MFINISLGFWVIGDVFLQNVYTCEYTFSFIASCISLNVNVAAFDVGNQQVGFATLK